MNRYVGVLYKLKSLLPLKARLQIYHSFVQAHLNFCSLVWGFAAKSHINSLLTGQKKGLRATVPGFTSNYYKDGALPTPTKPLFDKYKILTIHNIIVTNALLLMHRVRHFPDSLPQSVRETIATNAPTGPSDHELCAEWLSEYGNKYYSGSLFFKGPLLYVDTRFDVLVNTATLLTYKHYRTHAKTMLLRLQSRGDPESWQADNLILNTVNGLRRSKRLLSRSRAQH